MLQWFNWCHCLVSIFGPRCYWVHKPLMETCLAPSISLTADMLHFQLHGPYSMAFHLRYILSDSLPDFRPETIAMADSTAWVLAAFTAVVEFPLVLASQILCLGAHIHSIASMSTVSLHLLISHQPPRRPAQCSKSNSPGSSRPSLSSQLVGFHPLGLTLTIRWTVPPIWTKSSYFDSIHQERMPSSPPLPSLG